MFMKPLFILLVKQSMMQSIKRLIRRRLVIKFIQPRSSTGISICLPWLSTTSNSWPSVRKQQKLRWKKQSFIMEQLFLLTKLKSSEGSSGCRWSSCFSLWFCRSILCTQCTWLSRIIYLTIWLCWACYFTTVCTSTTILPSSISSLGSCPISTQASSQ